MHRQRQRRSRSFVHDRLQGGWVAEVDACGRTSIPGLYVVGDAGGIAGATAAEYHGELAGLAALHDLGRLDARTFRQEHDRVGARLANARRFGTAMGALMDTPGPGCSDSARDVVCRCEDVTPR
jgi:hypothetical protein